MSDKRYFVRVRGKVLGPFSAGQLRSLQKRGQFSRLDEVSEDRKTWVPASEVQGLFPAAIQVAAAAEPQPADNRKADGPAESDEWFFLNADQQQQGPLSRTQLLDMHRQGTLRDDTPVWTRRMAEWTPFAEALDGDGALRRRPRRDERGQPGSQAFVAFLKDPVGGLPGLCEALGPSYAFGMGLLFCGVFILFALLGFILLLYRLDLLRGFPGEAPFGFPFGEQQFRPAPRPGPPRGSLAIQAEVLIRFIGLTMLGIASLIAAISIIRIVTRGSGNFGCDVLSAGSALLPMGLLWPVFGVLGPANMEVVIFLLILVSCLTLLILNSAFTRVIKLSDQGVILAMPVTVVLTLWLCKVAVTSILFR